MAGNLMYMGVVVKAGRRPITYAVLDGNLQVQQLTRSSVKALVDCLLAEINVVCAIAAPSGANRGLLSDDTIRAQLGLSSANKRFSQYRLAEYELRRRNIPVRATPFTQDDARDWVKTGWYLYSHLRQHDYVNYPRPGARRLIETYPPAVFAALIGHRPYRRSTTEGRLQRQAVLYDEGIEVPDPMYILEEWTRHRLKSGTLDLTRIYSANQISALAAAYTAFVAEREPHNVTLLGDPLEGQIVIPVSSLNEGY